MKLLQTHEIDYLAGRCGTKKLSKNIMLKAVKSPKDMVKVKPWRRGVTVKYVGYFEKEFGEKRIKGDECLVNPKMKHYQSDFYSIGWHMP